MRKNKLDEKKTDANYVLDNMNTVRVFVFDTRLRLLCVVGSIVIIGLGTVCVGFFMSAASETLICVRRNEFCDLKEVRVEVEE